MSEQRETYTVAGQPRKLTTVRCWSDDAERLDALRKQLQALRLTDCTMADTLRWLLDQHDAATIKPTDDAGKEA